MATGDLSDADVWGAPAAPPSAATAPTKPAGDSAIPAAPEGTPSGSQPVEIEIEKGVSPNAREVDQDVAAADSKSAASDLNDADVWGSQAAAAPAVFAQPHGDDLLGLEAGLKRPIDNAAAWLEGGLEKLGLPVVEAEHAIGAKSAQDVRTEDENYLKLQAAQGRTPGIAGEVAGGFLGTLPAAALPGGLLVQGAAAGALGSQHDDAQGVALDAGLGAVGGKVAHSLIGAAQNVIAPVISPYVRTLLDAGVNLTPGQILGGTAHRIEDSLTSTPILGDAIRDAQIRGLNSLNGAAINRALEPLGIKLPANAQSGRAAIDFAHQVLSDGYDEVTSKMLPVQADQQFTHGVASAVQAMQGNLTADTRQQLADIVGNRVLSRFGQAGALDGQSFKDVDSQLGLLVRKFGGSPDPNQQHIGEALGAVQDELRAAAQRSNPALASRLNDLNSGWSNLVRVERAASGIGAKGGVFTGPQLQNAVRAADATARKSAFARGNAPMQDLSEAASKVMPSSVPDSGTALRYLISELPILLGVGAESHVLPLGGAGAAMLGGGAIGSAYTRTGGKIAQTLLTSRPAGAQYAADLLAQAKAPIAHLGATVGPLLQYAGRPVAPPASN